MQPIPDYLKSLRALSPGDVLLGEQYRAWLRECGEDDEQFVAPKVQEAHSFLTGSGIGSGIGIGSGSGRGSGSGIGSGSGRGSGSGSGSGSGIGSGSGRGSGSWRGSGSGRGRDFNSEIFMEIGKAYLVHVGDWHTFVGRVVAQTGPMTYRLESVSKVCETNDGDNWHELAAGNTAARKKAKYEHYRTPVILPLSIAAFEYVGKTPQEEGLK